MAALFAGRRRNEGLGRSVILSWASTPIGTRRRQRMSEGRRGGERRRAAPFKRLQPTQARFVVACVRSTRPSLGPSTRARRSSLCTRRASVSWWGVRFGITVGQTHASGRNQHWGRSGGRSAARRVSPPPQGGRRGTSRKGRRSRPPSLRGSRAPVGLLARRAQLQKSVGDHGPRISSANALQKERSGSSERGPSSERGSAGDTVGRRVARKVDRESDPPRISARGSAQGPGWRESAIQRSRHRQKRCRGRGTGVVTTTGSYEGSPVDGRHPGSSRGVPFTRGAHGRSWRPDASSDPCTEAKSRGHGQDSSPREGGGGARVAVGSRQGCQRLDRIGSAGRQRPRS
jgi:hypothetical protein